MFLLALLAGDQYLLYPDYLERLEKNNIKKRVLCHAGRGGGRVRVEIPS
jgi:hypothetical protein